MVLASDVSDAVRDSTHFGSAQGLVQWKLVARIRGYRPGDEFGIQAVVKNVYDEYGFTWDPADYHADLFQLPQIVDCKSLFYWVALDGRPERIVGCAGLRLFEAIKGEYSTVVVEDDYERIAGTDCDLLRLYVRSESRGLGLGRLLFEATISQAKALGRCAMEIWSDVLFTEAHQLYQRYGSEIVGERICKDPDKAKEHGLILSLNQSLSQEV